MEDNAQNQTEPAPPVPRIALPTGVKVTGWILLLLGAWNLSFGVAVALSLLPDPRRPELLVFLGLILPWAAVAFIGSSGLLRRKEWGRKATLFTVYYVMACLAVWAVVFNAALLGGPGTSDYPLLIILEIVISCGVTVAAVFGLYMLTRYLGKPNVRAAFRP